MEYIIYRNENEVVTSFTPTDKSAQENGVMMDDLLNLSFTLFEYHALEVNDYVMFEGAKYKLLEAYGPVHKSNSEYEYNCKFYGHIGDCRRAIVMELTGGDSNTFFSYTETALNHLELIVQNINRVKGTEEWCVGAVVETVRKDIAYDNTYCVDALGKIAETFNTEWWIEGTTINMSRCEHGVPIELGYGIGLQNLSKENNEKAKFFTRLIPVGTTRNIDRKEYGYSRLQLPGGVKYIERNLAFGIIEHSEEKAFAHIYPKRIGSVGKVRSIPTKLEDREGFIYYFDDPELMFDPNEYEIGGLTKMIVFQSGELDGRDFEVNFHSKEKEFEIINQYPYDNQQLPGGALIPETGDKYILYNIRMPKEYYSIAENEYQTEVEKYLTEYNTDPSIYKGLNDYVYFIENNISLKVGSRVKLLNKEYFTDGYQDTRVVKIVRNVINSRIMDVEFSNVVSKSRIEQIENSVVEMQAAFKEQESKALHVLRSWDSGDLTDYNVLSSWRSVLTFAKLVGGNLFRGIQRFSDGLISSDFLAGLTGRGFSLRKNEYGKWMIEADSLFLRDSLMVSELDFNRVSVTNGELWNAIAFGTIESVDKIKQIATVKLLEGEILSVAVNDICRGIFYNLGSDKDTDDGNGFKQMQGFGTAYFTPKEILPDGKSFRYELQSGSTFHPCKSMKFVAYGNFSDVTRQASAYQTRTYTRYIEKVNTWAIDPDKNIVAQYGDIDGLTIGGVTMKGTGSFQKNSYLSGVQIQFTPEQKEDLKGDDAYSVSLSSYEGLIKMTDDGVISTTLQEYNIISGENNVVLGDNNLITTSYTLSTRIQAFKGAEELTYDVTPSKGSYIVTMTNVGCSALISGGVLYILSVEDREQAYVDLTVNCEGHAVFTKRYSIVVVADGEDAIVVNVYSSNGNSFINGDVATTLICEVWRGSEDITATIPDNLFSWKRLSENHEGDKVWNELHQSVGNSIVIQNEDVYRRAAFECEVLIN